MTLIILVCIVGHFTVESQKGLLKTKDDKISLLEYELRLAREDMEELQELHQKDLAAASKGIFWYSSHD